LSNTQAFSARPNISLAFNHSVSGATVTWSITIYETSSQPTYSFYTNNNTLTYNIPGVAPATIGFTFDFRPAGLQTITLAGGSFTAPASSFTATASVTSNLLGTANVSQVITANLTPPPPPTPSWQTGTALPAATRGTAYSSTVTASPVTSYSLVSQSGGTGTYTVTQSGSNAIISGTPTATGTASVIVRANNSGSTADRTFTFTVNPATPVFTDTTLATAIRDVAYSDAVVATETPNTGYSSTASIPGLTFNSNGTITGTPTTLGTYNFTVSATNVTGTRTANVTLVVGRPIPVYTDSTVSSPAIWRLPYTDGVAATDATNYAINSGNFPPGLSLNASTGAITSGPTGPTAVGSFTFVIRASNETGGVNTPSRTIDVISPVRVNTATGPTASFVTGAVNVNTATGPTGSFVPGAVSVWDGNTWVPARLT
jgi:hypothetical protein